MNFFLVAAFLCNMAIGRNAGTGISVGVRPARMPDEPKLMATTTQFKDNAIHVVAP